MKDLTLAIGLGLIIRLIYCINENFSLINVIYNGVQIYIHTYIHMNEYLKNNNSIMIFIESLMHLMLS